MPRPRPPVARLGNLNHKGGHVEGDPPPKTGGGAPASLPSAPHRFLEGKGVGRYYTYVDEGNATCNL
eukprot:15344147-Ditylum_brightwellii.AAC.1